jgi:hypothetical protein
MKVVDTIEVKQNIHIVARERGKIVERRDGHNIFVDLGREWLAELIAYRSFSPDTVYRNDRVRYMGVGIGGSQQLALIKANAAPLVTIYPGTNTQTDVEPTVARLERPVRVTGSMAATPGIAGDRWIEQIQAPATFPTSRSTTFLRLFQSVEVSYGIFTSVPLSEIGLFTDAADPQIYDNTLIAYDTFDTLSKTSAVELEVSWTFSF